MSLPDNAFDVAIDKGTVDAILSGGGTASMSTTYRMFAEVARVVKRGGLFLLITSAGADQYLRLLSSDFATVRALKVEAHAMSVTSRALLLCVVPPGEGARNCNQLR